MGGKLSIRSTSIISRALALHKLGRWFLLSVRFAFQVQLLQETFPFRDVKVFLPGAWDHPAAFNSTAVFLLVRLNGRKRIAQGFPFLAKTRLMVLKRESTGQRG